MKLSKRGLIRAISFLTAAILVLVARNIILMRDNKNNQILIQNNYVHALEELSAAADNINNTLEKQLYAGTSEQQSKLANKLFTEASAAKAAMGQLPMKELSLENTYKFLSQVGNYAQSMAEKTSLGGELSNEEYKNLKALHEYAKKLSERMWQLEESVASGEIKISDAQPENQSESGTITEGFTEFEEGFESYPTLIYDGPFSDHIMEKEPLMTKDADEISKSKALERASMRLGISSADLSNVSEQDGKMPAWVFSDKDNSVACAVTKQGGYISYFIKSRQPSSANLSIKESVRAAKDFINDCGYKEMKVTYYERSGNTVTVNFAYTFDDVICYTDLMKVCVAMDDGEILGYEATGYLVNHQKREFPEECISIRECRKIVSPMLEIESENRTLIPSDGGEEIYCYEYKCSAENGREVLVYINAQTGQEEQILILLKSESGTLTM